MWEGDAGEGSWAEVGRTVRCGEGCVSFGGGGWDGGKMDLYGG